jgi:CheY-like chemotaxis protein
MGFANFTIAENGEETVEKCRGTDYDMIFMDCHMPKMNGYEATKRVREIDAERNHRTIIVAMTANALKGERENCLASGMDEYIVKPIEKHVFIRVLSRWIQFKKNAGPNLVQTIDTTPLLDLKTFREITNNDHDTETELAALFASQLVLSLEKLRAHLEDGEKWKEAAHSLKGSAATIGAMQLREAASQAQEMLNAPSSQRQEILKEIEDLASATMTALRQEKLVS